MATELFSGSDSHTVIALWSTSASSNFAARCNG